MINHRIRIAGSGRTSTFSQIKSLNVEEEEKAREKYKRPKKKVYEGLTGGSGPRNVLRHSVLTIGRKDSKFQYTLFFKKLLGSILPL